MSSGRGGLARSGKRASTRRASSVSDAPPRKLPAWEIFRARSGDRSRGYSSRRAVAAAFARRGGGEQHQVGVGQPGQVARGIGVAQRQLDHDLAERLLDLGDAGQRVPRREEVGLLAEKLRVGEQVVGTWGGGALVGGSLGQRDEDDGRLLRHLQRRAASGRAADRPAGASPGVPRCRPRRARRSRRPAAARRDRRARNRAWPAGRRETAPAHDTAVLAEDLHDLVADRWQGRDGLGPAGAEAFGVRGDVGYRHAGGAGDLLLAGPRRDGRPAGNAGQAGDLGQLRSVGDEVANHVIDGQVREVGGFRRFRLWRRGHGGRSGLRLRRSTGPFDATVLILVLIFALICCAEQPGIRQLRLGQVESLAPLAGTADQLVPGHAADAAQPGDPPGGDAGQLAGGGDAEALLARSTARTADRPAAASGVVAVAFAAASACLICSAVAGVSSWPFFGHLVHAWTRVVSGGTVSRSSKMSVQARVISCSEPNRLPASRWSAVRKNSTRPSRSTGSKMSSASCASSSVAEEAGRDQVVAPGGQLAAGHLVQGDGYRVQLGGLVVAVAAAGAEERVQVVLGADAKLGVRGSCQREVEQDQLAALALERAQGQVVRLDVAVPDASAVEELERLEQVLAEPLQLVDGQRAVPSAARPASVSPARYSTPMILRRWSGRSGVEGRVEQADHVRVGELAELLRLALQAAGGGVVQRDLEDALAAVLA